MTRKFERNPYDQFSKNFKGITKILIFLQCLPSLKTYPERWSQLINGTIAKLNYGKGVQWTLSISTNHYLELLSISNKDLSPFGIYTIK